MTTITTPAGYAIWQTGGGCEAFGRNIEGGYILITQADGVSIDGDPCAKDWIVGRYGEDTGFIVIGDPMTLAECLAIADRIPSPICAADINNVEETFLTLEAAIAYVEGAP